MHTACWQELRSNDRQNRKEIEMNRDREREAVNHPLPTVSSRCPICRHQIPDQTPIDMSWLTFGWDFDTPRILRMRSRLRANDDPAVAGVLGVFDFPHPIRGRFDIHGFVKVIVARILDKLDNDHPEFSTDWRLNSSEIAYNISHERDMMHGVNETPVLPMLRKILAPLTIGVLTRAFEIARETLSDKKFDSTNDEHKRLF